MFYDDEFYRDNVLKNRRNMDNIIDNNGRKLISLCKSTSHIIANGRLHNDTEGKFTFCASRGQSVTDYLLLNIFDTLSIFDFDVLEWNSFSDHAAIFFSFETIRIKEQQRVDQKTEKKIFYDDAKAPAYKNLLQQNINKLDGIASSENIDTKTEILTEFLHETAEQIFGKNVRLNQTKYDDKHNQSEKPKWFDESCFTSKQEFKTARNLFSHNKSTENRTSFVKARTKYNRARYRAKTRFKYNEGKKLENIAKTQPRKFWKSLKKCYKKPQTGNNNIKIDELYNHFNTLLSQEPENFTDDTDLGDVQEDDLDKIITEQEIRRAVFYQKMENLAYPMIYQQN